MSELSLTPIGYFQSVQTEKYIAPRQPGRSVVEQGTVVLLPSFNFEQALEDLEGFERIWLIYHFHRNEGWKPKVRTPRGEQKRGVFATRSPHRPNPIGLSCVEILEIKGRTLSIGRSDLLDGTPILDIKPYVVYADAFSGAKQGWLEEMPLQDLYEVEWSSTARLQADFIEEKTSFLIRTSVNTRLSDNPYPHPNHRIILIEKNLYQMACKSWRIIYSVEGKKVWILSLHSGYNSDTLAGQTVSKWDDISHHLEFQKVFLSS